MRNRKEINIGQLAREQWGAKNVSLIGFMGYKGEVIAGRQWGADDEVMNVPPAQQGSWEREIKDRVDRDSILIFSPYDGSFTETRGHRAIGVVYRPVFEAGNYVPTELSERYGIMIYLEKMSALNPIKGVQATDKPPETYPWGV